MWDKNAAVEYARKHAFAGTHHLCATYVRLAIEAGGIYSVRAHYVKDLGESLRLSGFYEVNGNPEPGDIAVIQAIPESAAGHTCIYDGKVWISDFVQLHGMYPGISYRRRHPAFKIYRHD